MTNLANLAELKLEYTHVHKNARVAILRIARPEARNALHPPASQEMALVLDALAADADVDAIVITGEGEQAFCAGNDLKYLAAGGTAVLPATGFGGLTGRFGYPKPLIAAVNGVAFGGGFELALACDLIVADERAVFALPEPRVGLVATAGGLLRLPRQIPLKQAMAIILAGKRVSAAQGLQMGFVNEVTAAGDVLKSALEWAGQIAQGSPLAVTAAKALVEHGLSEPELERIYPTQKQLPELQALYASEDSKEGALAFAQKRAPRWASHK